MIWLGGITMDGKTAKIRSKRITGKQRAARRVNIEVARRYKKKASKAKAVGKSSSRYKDKDTPKGQWKNKKTGSRLYGPNIYKP